MHVVLHKALLIVQDEGVFHQPVARDSETGFFIFKRDDDFLLIYAKIN